MRRRICRWRGHTIRTVEPGDVITQCPCGDRIVIAVWEGTEVDTAAAMLRIRAGNETDEGLAAWLRAAADEITQEANG